MTILNKVIGIFVCIFLQSCLSWSSSNAPALSWYTGTYHINAENIHLVLMPLSYRYYKVKNEESGMTRNYKSHERGVVVIGQSWFCRWESDHFIPQTRINILPAMHFTNPQTAELFAEEKWAPPEYEEMGEIYRVKNAKSLIIYHKGIKLEINLDNDVSDEKYAYYFELRDGMYYEAASDKDMGMVLEAYDFYKDSVYQPKGAEEPNFYWLYDVKRTDENGRYIRTLTQGIQYFKPMEKELWMISPYGSYILDYATELIRVVDAGQFRGHEFYYADTEKRNNIDYGTIDFDNIAPP